MVFYSSRRRQFGASYTGYALASANRLLGTRAARKGKGKYLLRRTFALGRQMYGLHSVKQHTYGLIPRPGGVEHKYIDVSISGQDVSRTGAVQLLNGISQGLTASSRIGNRITIDKIYVQGIVVENSTTPVTIECKLALILDKEPEGTSMALTGADATTNRMYAATATNMTPYTMLELANSQRYTVLWQKSFLMKQQFNGAVEQKNFKLIYKGKPIMVQYNGDGNTVSAIANGSLYLASWANIASGNSSALLYANSRIRYTDT